MEQNEHREGEPVPEGFTVINNCSMAFECPKTWATLNPTENTDVRHCDSCNKEVTFCSDEGQLERMTEAGACVAFYTVRNEVARVLTGSIARKPGKPRRDDRIRAFIDRL